MNTRNDLNFDEIDLSINKATDVPSNLGAINRILEAQTTELRSRAADFDIFSNTIQAGTSKHIFDDAMTCYWANDYFFFMTGYSRQEFEKELHNSPIPIVDDEDVRNFISELSFSIQAGIDSFQILLHITHKEGHRLCFKTAVSIIPTADNRYYFYCIHTDITTAVRNQELAAKQSQLLEAICDSMIAGICQLSVNSDMTVNAMYVNKVAYDILECEPHDLKNEYGGNILKFIHRDSVPTFSEALSCIIMTGESSSFETKILTKSGNVKWLFVTMRRLDDDSEDNVLVCEFRDISERKQLRAEKASILDNLPGFVSKYIIKDKPYLLEANDKFYEFFGTSFEDYERNKTIYVKSFPGDVGTQIELAKDDILNRRPVSFSYRTYKADGSIAWLQLQGSCIDEMDGFPVYLAVQIEITQIKELQLRLETEKERYRFAYRTSTSTLFEYDILKDEMTMWRKGTSDTEPYVISEYLSRVISEKTVYKEDIGIVRSFLSGKSANTDNKLEVRYAINEFGKQRFVWAEIIGTTLYSDSIPVKVIGIYNNISDQDYALYDKIESCIAEDKKTTYAIVRMDIDNFKMVNDLYGWSEGDKILSYIANLLKDLLADAHCPFGRVTADIFCFCVPYSDRAKLIQLIREIKLKIQEYPIDFNIIPHFGIYIAEPGCTTPASVMFDWANLALKTVTEKVYTPFAFFDENLRDKLLSEKRLEHDMHVALKTGQFATYLQPKYDISTGKIVGAEALVRWIHPENGIMAPDKFIPLFERNGFIVKVDEYVWETVCKTMSRWKADGKSLIPISINISRIHIFDPHFCSKLKHLAAKYKIPPNLLVLEFTESVFLDNVDELCKTMTELSDAGFMLSMDDFGSGFSSLNMLKTVPLNEVKIDKEFLNETVASMKGKTVVASTIFMVNQLEMKIIAEGVETAEQAEFLLAAGCDTAQGFYYSRPIPLKDFEKLAFGE